MLSDFSPNFQARTHRFPAFLGILLFVAGGAAAQDSAPYTIATAVGPVPVSPVDDVGPTAAFPLNYPTSVAVDHDGNVYFSDWSAQIFRMDARTSQVTVIAGTGLPGFAGDGGPATQAQLGGPGSLAVDAAGNVYFGDVRNYRVREIAAATGIITTVAGNGGQFDSGQDGPATQLAIGYSPGHAVDAAGNLYFSNGGYLVRKLTVATGLTTTVAGFFGTGSRGDGGPATQAAVDQPEGLALDAQGNLYIAARGEQRIRKVDAATGIITTIAGSSVGVPSFFGIVLYAGGFSGDGGPATAALLSDPEFVAVDRAGNVYISDTQNFRIRKIDGETGIIQTIAGTGINGYIGDGGAAVNAEISYPAGIHMGREGRVYFADSANGRIRVLLPAD